MKKIEAIIRKTKFEDVKEALLAADIEWFSYYDVRGEGKMRQERIYRGVMYSTSSIERVLMNIVVRDKNVEKTVAAIEKAAKTVRSVTVVSSSFQSRTLSASELVSVAISPSIMRSRRSERKGKVNNEE